MKIIQLFIYLRDNRLTTYCDISMRNTNSNNKTYKTNTQKQDKAIYIVYIIIIIISLTQIDIFIKTWERKLFILDAY
jgi:hypothetical protein